jgi:hypothetical protein
VATVVVVVLAEPVEYAHVIGQPEPVVMALVVVVMWRLVVMLGPMVMPEPVEYALVLLVYALILPPLAVPLMMRVLSIETHR